MMRPGESFEDPEVARAYLHRPDYSPGIYHRLLDIAPNRQSLLDLGCGTGKISRRLSGHFRSVTAIDASMEMLRIAFAQEAAKPDRITWIHGLAEETQLDGAPFDLVVAAASIHWMDHAVVFPRLLCCVQTDHVFAVVDGDAPFNPPWQAEWDSFLAYWIYELKGEAYDPAGDDGTFHRWMNRYRRWLDVEGEMEALSEPMSQRIDDFIACQHSRDTFTRAKLGSRLPRFDHELRLLEPYAEKGVLTLSVQSNLVWGTIRHEPDDEGPQVGPRVA
jgi:SAM-dependent methyltransferase